MEKFRKQLRKQNRLHYLLTSVRFLFIMKKSKLKTTLWWMNVNKRTENHAFITEKRNK